MAYCSPTTTLFGTTVVSTLSVETIVSTVLESGIYDGITVISTCFPTVVATSTTCVPTVYTTNVGGITTFTSLITTFQTVSVVQTISSPTQILPTACAQSPDEPGVKDTTSSSSTTTTPYVAPVTLTRTLSSTDPSGNVIIATVATVSTPSPDSTQSDSGSGGPNTTAVIGGAVGGVVGLIALICIIWFIMRKRRSGVRWDDIWEDDGGHQAEVKYGAPAATGYGSSPNQGVVGSGTPSPLLRGDQPTGVHSHSRSTSVATGYATHRQSNSQTPFTLATSSAYSPPNSPPSLQQQLLPGAGAANLEGTQTPIWASPSAQQGYFHQGSPPIPSDPNYTQTVTSTYNVTSHTTPATTYSTHGHTTANPVVAYARAVSPPIVEKRHSTYNDHKPPLDQSQQGSAGQPSQHQQVGPSGSTTKLAHVPIENSAPSQDPPPPAYQQ